jgi:hypothetical protein
VGTLDRPGGGFPNKKGFDGGTVARSERFVLACALALANELAKARAGATPPAPEIKESAQPSTASEPNGAAAGRAFSAADCSNTRQTSPAVGGCGRGPPVGTGSVIRSIRSSRRGIQRPSHKRHVVARRTQGHQYIAPRGARFTGQQHHLTFAGLRFRPPPQEQFEFFFPSHKLGQAAGVKCLEPAFD